MKHDAFQEEPNRASDNETSLVEILIEEITDRLSNGEKPTLSEYLNRYPECAEGLNEYWSVIMALQHASEKSDVSVDSPMVSDSPSERLDFLHEPIVADVSGMETEELERRLSEKQEPRIGRYTIVRQIGQGGFGIVLLAVDDQLDRSVAIKLPHLHRMQHASTSHLYVQEAKMLAQLDHPAVVPIYDCGVIPDGRCFVVSKYIEGEDLAQLMRARRLLRTVANHRMLREKCWWICIVSIPTQGCIPRRYGVYANAMPPLLNSISSPNRKSHRNIGPIRRGNGRSIPTGN